MQEVEAARSHNALTIYIDQAKFYDAPDLRAMWVLKGQPAEVVTTRSGRQKIMVYGAYCPQLKWLYTEVVPEETNIETASFLIALRIRFPYRRLDIVLDNAPWHSGATLREITQTYHLHLHYLPSYSPDLNPIEPLWLWTRQEKTYNTEYNSAQVKEQELVSFWQTIGSQVANLETRLVPTFTIDS